MPPGTTTRSRTRAHTSGLTGTQTRAKLGRAFSVEGRTSTSIRVAKRPAQTDAGIVEDPTQWPGLFTRVEDAGRRRVERFEAPRWIRREDGTQVPFRDHWWPDFVELVQEPLCEAIDMDPDACVTKVREYVEARIANKRAEQAKKGWRFVGVLQAMHQRVTKRAASWYTPPCLEGKIAPRVKAGTGEGVARAKALWRLFAFWDAHADARRRILAGELGVVFPAGTFRWHHLFGFPCEEMEAAFFESAAFR